MKVILKRVFENSYATYGRLMVIEDEQLIKFDCATLELPWFRNRRNISCIPVGEYPLRPYVSNAYGICLEVAEVPERDLIRIHSANYVNQLRGCIAVGKSYADINKDGITDITFSRQTLRNLLDVLGSETHVLEVS
ncbi:DUF5675 family protein [Aureibacter tunicatorum]|uniref:DUF5675 domain-containing protein n=1 Tax=Aureibacter tunicatorum TaxID=866807 RepID=A0AAE3XJK2_9BACT|nr:DUF5675 family protein [Aureibacter tunicatorum]MDR6237135.1 hypothetical protein [Aureibacter tunicatorum]